MICLVVLNNDCHTIIYIILSSNTLKKLFFIKAPVHERIVNKNNGILSKANPKKKAVFHNTQIIMIKADQKEKKTRNEKCT